MSPDSLPFQSEQLSFGFSQGSFCFSKFPETGLKCPFCVSQNWLNCQHVSRLDRGVVPLPSSVGLLGGGRTVARHVARTSPGRAADARRDARGRVQLPLVALNVSRRQRHWSRQTRQLRELRCRRTVGWWWRGWGRAGDQGGCAQPGWCQGFADGGRVGTPTKLALLVALNLLAFSLMCVGSGLFLEFLRRGNVTVQHAFLRVSAQRANQAGWAKR